MSEKFLNLSEVMNRTGLSKTSIWRGQKEGTFPTSYSISAKRVAWKSSEIDQWIEARVRSGSTDPRNKSVGQGRSK